MMNTLKRALSVRRPRGVEVVNPETGCRGVCFAVLESEHEVETKYDAPHHTDKCKCLTTRDISHKALIAHVDQIFEHELIEAADLGPLTLKLILRLPVPKAFELKLEPKDTSLRVKLAPGEAFPLRLEQNGTLQSFPALDESNL